MPAGVHPLDARDTVPAQVVEEWSCEQRGEQCPQQDGLRSRVEKTWNDLDMYVTLEDTAEMTKIETYAKGMAKVLHEAQVKLAEAVFKREWSEECPILSLLIPGTRKWWIVRMPI